MDQQNFFRRLNVIRECGALGWGLWQCPPFLMLVLGGATIISMLATYVLASRYIDEPELAALVVLFVAAFLLVLGHFIVEGFNRIAEANRMKSEFISIVSHQLRAPLSIFKWTVGVVHRSLERGENGTNVMNSVSTLVDTTEDMIRLVNSLLEVNRIEARNFVLSRENFSLVTLTESVLAHYRGYVRASHLTFESHVDPALPMLNGDRDRILIVIQNLIDNAVRYTKNGDIIRVSIQKQRKDALWSVEDNGVGIPAAQQKYIFQKFFRAKNSRLFQTEGTGIGLYMAKAIIEASGGRIGFSSQEGKGSTFWFSLPLPA